MKKSRIFAAVLIACVLVALGFSANAKSKAYYSDGYAPVSAFTLPAWEYVLFDHHSTLGATLYITVTTDDGVSAVISFENSITA